jgi:GntR family transcriptional regulator
VKPINIVVDFRSDVPGYVQIVEQMRAHLANGSLAPGDQLPTVRQMASELRINFNTVARAYRMLDEAGLISTQRGRGTYILESAGKEEQEQLQHSALKVQVDRFLTLVKSQGYTRQAVEAAIQIEMKAWKMNSLPEENETQTGEEK